MKILSSVANNELLSKNHLFCWKDMKRMLVFLVDIYVLLMIMIANALSRLSPSLACHAVKTREKENCGNVTIRIH